jgi:hypothetical protein
MAAATRHTYILVRDERMEALWLRWTNALSLVPRVLGGNSGAGEVQGAGAAATPITHPLAYPQVVCLA